MQEVYYTLVDENEDEKTYKQTVTALNKYFIPKSNVPLERHLFRQLAQSADETVDQFVCRLRQQAVTCDFGAAKNDHIRDQVIEKFLSDNLRRKFLEKDILQLSDVLTMAKAHEAVEA